MGQLTLEQRYTIQVLKKQVISQKEIAREIERDPSVISRELKRNCDKRSGEYKAALADKKCINRHKTKHKRIVFTSDIKDFVEHYIKEDYSPEQISGLVKLVHRKCVSTERIYQHI